MYLSVVLQTASDLAHRLSLHDTPQLRLLGFLPLAYLGVHPMLTNSSQIHQNQEESDCES
jgi:hypothetical protein